MKLAVIIINWNAVADTERCLASVKQWPTGTTFDPTVWIVDNGSTLGDVGALQAEHPDLRILRSAHNRGFAGGNNLALQAALEDQTGAFLLLNNDAAIEWPDLITLLATLDADPTIGIVGPTLWDGDELISAGGYDIALERHAHRRPSSLPREPYPVAYVPGTVALIKREALESVGLLDERFFFSGEMADLCHRARENGFRCVIVPSTRASHDLNRSAELRGTLHAYYIFRNRFLFIGKHHEKNRRRLFAYWTLHACLAAGSRVLRGHADSARAIWRGLLDGLSGRFGPRNERILGHDVS